MENDTIKADDILNYCLSNLDDVVLMDSWGERAIYYNPNGVLKRGVYVLTIKEKTVIMIKVRWLVVQMYTV
nr:DUF6194 family protein [Clostridioides difficile]